MDIKICGLTHPDDALAALAFGADYLGFVFYRGSPRAVTPEQAAGIIRRLPAAARCVGVFVDANASEAAAVAGACGLCAVQLHGHEAAADFSGFPLPLWRAVRFESGEPLPAPADWPAERYVADSAAASGGRTGGTGRTTDWAAAAHLAQHAPLMLAGGLTPENVAAAIAAVQPVGVDTAGGVEFTDRPGRKNHLRMRRFIEHVRACHEKQS